LKRKPLSSGEGGKRATIHDVARHAGVSHMTVSRVINGDSRVREKKRLAIVASIEALRFSPNSAAQSLANGQGFLIGLCYANPTDAYLAEVLLGCYTQANLSNCQLLLERRLEAEPERATLKRVMESGVDGVILTPPFSNSKEALNTLAEAGFPASLLTSGRPAKGFSAVSIDDRKAAREMTEHLIRLGHHRIGIITGHPNHSAAQERFCGFKEAMESAGLEVGGELVAPGLCTYHSGLEAAELLLRNDLTAIFACNEEMAMAAISVAYRKGLDVPADISIAGFDDSPLATTITPALTVVRRPIADMAAEALKLLAKQLSAKQLGRSLPVTHRMLDFAIVTRASTGLAPARAKGCLATGEHGKRANDLM
jgi:LacI family transcriptional regulator